MKDPHSVIKTIRLTEKATRLGDENNEYVFIVDPKSTKIEIKQAVEKHFGKKVVAVRTAHFAGKARRQKRCALCGPDQTQRRGAALCRDGRQRV